MDRMTALARRQHFPRSRFHLGQPFLRTHRPSDALGLAQRRIGQRLVKLLAQKRASSKI